MESAPEGGGEAPLRDPSSPGRRAQEEEEEEVTRRSRKSRSSSGARELLRDAG
jgi:hypothetical protein